MTTDDRDALIEAVTSAWRPLGSEGSVRPLSSWYDLDASGRLEAFEAAVELRRLEAAADPRRADDHGACSPGANCQRDD